MSTTPSQPLRLLPLGGLGEFGLNLMIFEQADDLLVVDCGVMFPETAQLGVEIVIPDMTYLFERAERVRGIVLTHGHEDHIGALPYLLERVSAPVYGSRLTLGLVREKLRERGLLRGADLREVASRDVESIGSFQVEFLRVTHSIPDSLALAIETAAGRVIHTADFKMDQTPVDGRLMDYQRFCRHGEDGVLALLSDSTNAERSGYTRSESSVTEGLERLIRAATGRIVISVFSSNIHRIQQVVNLAKRYQRYICLAGRSISQATRVAEELGLLHMPPGTVMEPREVSGLPPHRVLILAGGSQGEPMSALSRIALANHKQIRLESGDLVILSARPIPGNERAIARMVNHLNHRGARVVQSADPPCHVSGHASQEELKMMMALTRPRYLLPVHGEYRQLAAHARLAREMGVPRERVLLAEDGDLIEMTPEAARVVDRVPVGTVLIDGAAGKVAEPVMRDRRHLSGDGLLIPVVVINRSTGRMESPPQLVSRGFVWDEGEGNLQGDLVERIGATVQESSAEERGDRGVMRTKIQEDLRRFLRKRAGRRPMIIPIVIET